MLALFLVGVAHLVAAAHHDVTVDVKTLGWILGVACPIVTAIITKESPPPWAKAITNALLATLATLLAVAIKADGHFDLNAWIAAFANTFVLAWASYAGFSRAAVTPFIAKATKSVGIGPAELPAAA